LPRLSVIRPGYVRALLGAEPNEFTDATTTAEVLE
jgi:hypothetical protein